jgi:hypothetical protein
MLANGSKTFEKAEKIFVFFEKKKQRRLESYNVSKK